MQELRRRVLSAVADGPVTGPALAETLDVSRAAVWKHVEALREAGFDIAGTDDGYVLESVPEFGGAAVEFGLEAPYEVEYHDTIPSTNDRARELAAEGSENVVVLADSQSGGRGRLDRPWTSPSGSVLLSILFRPTLPPNQVPIVTLAAAVATTTAAREAGVPAGIKWPNDVLVPAAESEREAGDPESGGYKLAGILTEMEGEADRVSWVVPGIGVNANVPLESLPDTATSLQAEVGPVDRRTFTQVLLERFHDLAGDPEAVLPAWREQATTLGQRVRVETPGGEVVGEAVDIEFPGVLVVETETGRERVTAGDCEHLRPA